MTRVVVWDARRLPEDDPNLIVRYPPAPFGTGKAAFHPVESIGAAEVRARKRSIRFRPFKDAQCDRFDIRKQTMLNS
jgi:hypothetical protein